MEHRYNTRIPIVANAVLHTHEGDPTQAQIYDLSFGGMRIGTDRDVGLYRNSFVQVTCLCGGQITVMDALVAYREIGGAGLMFIDLSNELFDTVQLLINRFAIPEAGTYSA